jgi:F-type H+-transporting ATPase subunit a
MADTTAVAETIEKAAEPTAAEASAAKMEIIQSWVEHHIADGGSWHPIPGLPAINLEALGLSLHGAMLIIAALILIVFGGVIAKKGIRIRSRLSNLFEVLVVFVRDEIAIPAMGEKDGRAMTPLLCNFFFFITVLNCMGLVPIFVTATANFSITCALSLITFVFMVGGALIKNGPIGFAKSFIPSGVPVPVLFLIAPLEFVGLFIKTFALMVRLFANMLAGHMAIFVLLGLIVLCQSVAIKAVATLVFVPFALFIYMLEVLIALLQAYIFTLLSAMFIGMTWHPDH